MVVYLLVWTVVIKNFTNISVNVYADVYKTADACLVQLEKEHNQHNPGKGSCLKREIK